MTQEQTQDAALETRQLIVDTATKIFTDHCDKALLDSAEAGEFAGEVHANGAGPT